MGGSVGVRHTVELVRNCGIGTVKIWRTTYGDVSDVEWAVIENVFVNQSQTETIGWPAKEDKHDVVGAIFYVLARGPTVNLR